MNMLHWNLYLLYDAQQLYQFKKIEISVYEPKENYLLKQLKRLPMFHDQEYVDSLSFEERDILAMP